MKKAHILNKSKNNLNNSDLYLTFGYSMVMAIFLDEIIRNGTKAKKN